MRQNINPKPELLAPAGNLKMLNAAIHNGADAVYFGLDKFNMRAKANNFNPDNLASTIALCHENNVKAHLTLNSIIYENELSELENTVLLAKESGIDLIICWDMAVISLCVKYGVPFCISTQASISNSLSANYFANLGADRIVLARECTLEQIKEIRKNTNVQIESFIHGAMCIAISGRCFMSHSIFSKSANRGECIQPCRREYKIIDNDSGNEMILGDDYVLSPKDLCSIMFIDKLIEAGINSFKIEGRKRSPEYVAAVCSVYREAIDLHYNDALDDNKKTELFKRLKKVYNRGFSAGFYFGKPDSEAYTSQYGSIAETKKMYIGKVINYFKKTGIAHLKLEAGNIEIGDEVYFIGNNTGVFETEIRKIVVNNEDAQIAFKGTDATIPVDKPVRINDELYKIINVKK